MRIALVSMHTSPSAQPGSGDAGGMNVVVAAAARALALRGNEVIVATRASETLAAGEYPLAGVSGGPGAPRLVAIDAGAPDLAKGELPGVVSDFASGLRDLGPFDAVHGHYWLSGLAAHAAFRERRGGVAVTFHTIAAQKNARLAAGDRPEPAARIAAERSLTASSSVIAGSASELAAVSEHYGAPGFGEAVVHPGVDTDLFRPLARPAADAHTEQAPLRVTVLGRVQPLKGQDLALRAAAELAATDPSLFASTEWIIAGEPTPGAEGYAAGLRELADERGIGANVRFLPAQSRPAAAALLASSDLVLVPSHSETFGLTALEAAACGVPVVSGGHTGLLEAVPVGVSGLHVDGRDPRAWASTVATLLMDGALRARLGESARLYAESHDWLAHAAKLERIYERLAA
ncbi:glycosyltransferase [Leucobacter komagatae]|uniref:glycosyltransferase n=1 Tax=Leucobacter komagatae TaxID=55969 RepID=UPI0005ACE4EB|nr:glycosyltransferase [Leucobacter komagatae]